MDGAVQESGEEPGQSAELRYELVQSISPLGLIGLKSDDDFWAAIPTEYLRDFPTQSRGADTLKAIGWWAGPNGCQHSSL